MGKFSDTKILDVVLKTINTTLNMPSKANNAVECAVETCWRDALTTIKAIIEDLRAANEPVQAVEYADFERLKKAVEHFLARWQASGPRGSAQWEKFDTVIQELQEAIR